MIDHVIANAIPSDVGLFGVYMHGLFKTPNRAYYQSEVEVVTRSGRHVTLESIPREATPQHNPPSILPRPILYMHPSAVMRQEAADGTDFSGYCIFYAYQYMARYLGYLPRGYYVQFAYTPDSGGKGIAFDRDNRYLTELFIGSNIETGGNAQGVSLSFFTLCGATPDGRNFVYGRNFPTLTEIFNMTSWSPAFFPRIHLSTLSGERGNIVRTERSGPQPQYDHHSDFEREVGGRLSGSVFMPAIGQCLPPYDPEFEVVSTPDPMRPDYRRTFDRRASDIDVCDNALAPTFLSCAIEREAIESRSDSVDGGGYATWGTEQCGASSESRICTGTSTNYERIYNQEFVDEVKITLSGWGSTSSVTARNESSSRDVYARATVDGVVTSETSSIVHDGSISVVMDGITIMSESNMPAVSNPLATVLWTLPPTLTAAGSQGHVYLRFPHTSHPAGSIVAGETYSFTGIYKINLGAEGVHALACFNIRGTLVGSGGQLTLDPATTQRKLIIGRIFGFGISREGFEVPPELMDERLFIAYDPLEKKFSDIYTHPIYYQ